MLAEMHVYICATFFKFVSLCNFIEFVFIELLSLTHAAVFVERLGIIEIIDIIYYVILRRRSYQKL